MIVICSNGNWLNFTSVGNGLWLGFYTLGLNDRCWQIWPLRIMPFSGYIRSTFIYRAIPGDVIKWKHFPRYWPFVHGINWSPVNSPHKDQLRVALMFSLICAWINGWVNNDEAGDLRRHSARYDVTVIYAKDRVITYILCIVDANQYSLFKKQDQNILNIFLLILEIVRHPYPYIFVITKLHVYAIFVADVILMKWPGCKST